MNLFTVNLVIGHRDILVPEIHSKETVGILTRLIDIEKTGRLDASVMQLVRNLTNLNKEITPLAAVITQQRTLLRLLGNDKIGTGSCILTAIKEPEISIGQETPAFFLATIVNLTHVKMLSHENVLLVQGIAFTQCLDDSGHQTGEVIITVGVSRELLNWVLHLQNSRILSTLRIENADTIRILYRVIYILKDICSLATRAKGPDGSSHTYKETDKSYDNYDCPHNISI